VSQILTLYTTPVIYLMLDRLHQRWGGRQTSSQGIGNLLTKSLGPGRA
jgi:multidrug efflux pump